MNQAKKKKKKATTTKHQCSMHKVLQNTQDEKLNSTQIRNKHDPSENTMKKQNTTKSD